MCHGSPRLCVTLARPPSRRPQSRADEGGKRPHPLQGALLPRTRGPRGSVQPDPGASAGSSSHGSKPRPWSPVPATAGDRAPAAGTAAGDPTHRTCGRESPRSRPSRGQRSGRRGPRGRRGPVRAGCLRWGRGGVCGVPVTRTLTRHGVPSLTTAPLPKAARPSVPLAVTASADEHGVHKHLSVAVTPRPAAPPLGSH